MSLKKIEAIEKKIEASEEKEYWKDKYRQRNETRKGIY